MVSRIPHPKLGFQKMSTWMDAVSQWGAVGDGVKLSDASMTSGSAVLNSPSAAFTSGDIGKLIQVTGAGAGGGWLVSTILSVQSSTTVTLNDAAASPAPNQRADYGTDNTTALQNMLGGINLDGSGPAHDKVAYIPPGTYLISDTLQLAAKLCVSVWGHHPSTVTVVWCGAVDGEMFHLNGVSYSNIGRITWDGAGKAQTAVVHRWDGTGFAVTNQQHADEVFQGVKFGIRAGVNNMMDAETAVLRCKFFSCSYAGISIESFNAVDWYIWQNEFYNCYDAVTNTPRNGTGAGNFYCFDNYLEGSTHADFINYNTEFFIFRGNYSLNAKKFYQNTQNGFDGAVWLQDNIILDPIDDTAIETRAGGPYTMLDNIIRSRSGSKGPVISIINNYNLTSIGNTFTVPNCIRPGGKLISINDSIIPASKINPTPPIYWDTPANTNYPVIELVNPLSYNVTPALLAAIAQLPNYVGQNPILHIPPGGYNTTAAITFPDQDFQIWGDGFSSALGDTTTYGETPMYTIPNGDKVILNHIHFRSINAHSPCLAVYCSDTPGQLIYFQNLFTNGQGTDINHPALLIKGFVNSIIESHQFQAGNATGWGIISDGSDVRLFTGASSDTQNMYDVLNGGKILVQGVWYESSQITTYLNPTGPGEIHIGACKVATTNQTGNPAFVVNGTFSGKVTLAGINANGTVTGNGANAAMKLLAISMDSFQQMTDNTTAGKMRVYNNLGGQQSAAMDIPFVLEMMKRFRDTKPLYMKQTIGFYAHRVMVDISKLAVQILVKV